MVSTDHLACNQQPYANDLPVIIADYLGISASKKSTLLWQTVTSVKAKVAVVGCQFANGASDFVGCLNGYLQNTDNKEKKSLRPSAPNYVSEMKKKVSVHVFWSGYEFFDDKTKFIAGPNTPPVQGRP